MDNNTDLWEKEPYSFEVQVVGAAFAAHFFRWHSAGDIPDAEYLSMMCRVARICSSTCFLCFTKKYELVNDFICSSGPLPSNLCIVLSAWGDWMPDNPHNLPVAYVKLKDGSCQIPETAMECTGFCGQCVTDQQNCWMLKPGESVYFHQH